MGQAGRPGEIGKSGAVPTCIVGPAPILSESERASGADADGLEKKYEQDDDDDDDDDDDSERRCNTDGRGGKPGAVT